jgi:hypothetical protein
MKLTHSIIHSPKGEAPIRNDLVLVRVADGEARPVMRMGCLPLKGTPYSYSLSSRSGAFW